MPLVLKDLGFDSENPGYWNSKKRFVWNYYLQFQKSIL